MRLAILSCHQLLFQIFKTIKLKSTTSSSVIKTLKSIFSMYNYYGIPETVISNNGPQYSSYELGNFALSYKFYHVISSLLFPQTNRQAKRTVQTAKRLLKNAEDPYMVLLTYRTARCNLTPAQLLIGRHLQTTLPQVDDHLQPQWKYLETFRTLNKQFKEKQKIDFDC